MKAQSKIIERALELKSQGFTHMVSIVKRYKYTNYYHVVSIDDVLKNGKWIPASFGRTSRGAKCRIGITSNHIDWAKTARR